LTGQSTIYPVLREEASPAESASIHEYRKTPL